MRSFQNGFRSTTQISFCEIIGFLDFQSKSLVYSSESQVCGKRNFQDEINNVRYFRVVATLNSETATKALSVLTDLTETVNSTKLKITFLQFAYGLTTGERAAVLINLSGYGSARHGLR